jgi:hypothetical protein
MVTKNIRHDKAETTITQRVVTTQLHDSGKREDFDTGAVRDASEGKASFELISPFVLEALIFDTYVSQKMPGMLQHSMKRFFQFLQYGDYNQLELALRYAMVGRGEYGVDSPDTAIGRLAAHCAAGAKKYSDRNWEKGMPFSRVVDSALRHAYKLAHDEDDGEDHFAAYVWNLMALIHYYNVYGETKLNDLVFYEEVQCD